MPGPPWAEISDACQPGKLGKALPLLRVADDFGHGDEVFLGGLSWVERGDAGKQAPRVRVQRAFEDRRSRGILDDAPRVHDA